jgi:predicted CoA-substrate-specific enzyme activase
MNKGKILAGVDAGHVHTNAVIMGGDKILGYCTAPTGFDAAAAARRALNDAADNAGISGNDLDGIVTTGIFKDLMKASPAEVIGSVPEYTADAKGALLLNKKSRTLIDIGGNTHKIISYDEKGNLLDVVQNDKCADGMGIFYRTMAKTFGVSEQKLSELALASTGNCSLAVQCALSAQSDAIDLICQGMDIPDVADAVVRFIVERVADMCTYMSLTEEVVAAGGLARSQALINHLSGLLKHEVSVLKHPEYVGAIGAVIHYERGE